jgi:predicted Zn-dependent peptidase
VTPSLPNVGAELAALDARIERSILASGARLLTDTIPDAPSVSIGCWVGAGSRDEPDDLAGASHFLEHLLFKGTAQRSAREVNRAVDAVGGEFNAYTTRESTVFYLRVPATSADMATELLAEVVTQPRLDPADVEIERGVILEELDAALDSPDDLVFMRLAEALYPGHPSGREVLGTESSITSLDRDVLAAYHQRWYRPANFVVAAAGALDHDRLAARLGPLLGDAGGERPERTAPGEMASADVMVERPIEQAHLAYGWRGLRDGDPDRYALAVLNHVLGDGPSSRLYDEVREQRGLAYAVTSSASAHSDVGSFSVYCATAPEAVAEVRSLVESVLDDVVRNGIEADELEIAVGYLTGSMVLGLEDSGARMSRLGASELARGRVVTIAEALAGLAGVDDASVRRVAERILAAPRVTVQVGPGRLRDAG